MKASELRIGNYVFNQDEMEVQEVFSIDTEGINPCVNPNDGYDMFYYNYEPIQLTEKWLFDFGFEEGEDTEYTNNTYVRNGVSFWNKNRDFTCIIFETFRGLEMKHVHQLQNLYFALTGEELTIKEKQCQTT